MRNDDTLRVVVFGFLLGISFFAALLALIPDTYHNQARKAIAECEKNLPRDQNCKIIAVRK